MSNSIVVLVVDDELLIRMDISDELQDLGFRVLEAANAAEAVQILVAYKNISVLFTDIDMPGSMDGLMLAAAVRKRWPPIKIIVTSGHRRVTLEDMPGETRFFGKPYQAKAVALAMHEMVA